MIIVQLQPFCVSHIKLYLQQKLCCFLTYWRGGIDWDLSLRPQWPEDSFLQHREEITQQGTFCKKLMGSFRLQEVVQSPPSWVQTKLGLNLSTTHSGTVLLQEITWFRWSWTYICHPDNACICVCWLYLTLCLFHVCDFMFCVHTGETPYLCELAVVSKLHFKEHIFNFGKDSVTLIYPSSPSTFLCAKLL